MSACLTLASMGSLARWTRCEIEQLPEFEAELLGAVAERGSIAVREHARCHGWSEVEVWQWLRENEKRWEAYVEAKRFKSEMGVGETLGIADKSGDGKLQVATRFKVARSWYKEEYGDRVDVAHSGVMPVLNITIVGEGVLPLVVMPEKVVEKVEQVEQIEQVVDENDDGSI